MFCGYKKIGSGILSYMSAQAGANQVIALEASSMAEKIEIVRIVSKKKEKTHNLITDLLSTDGESCQQRKDKPSSQRPYTHCSGYGGE